MIMSGWEKKRDLLLQIWVKSLHKDHPYNLLLIIFSAFHRVWMYIFDLNDYQSNIYPTNKMRRCTVA